MSESTNDYNKLRKCSIIFCCSFSARVAWLAIVHVYVVVQFCPWFKFYFPLCLGMIMYDNEFETMKNKI